jgi:hypothetical protein
LVARFREWYPQYGLWSSPGDPKHSEHWCSDMRNSGTKM